jgi:AcrR family transcriptional regulator
MTGIAARAGASIGSLYQFFPSKELLAEALFERYVARATAGFENLVTRAPGLTAQRLAGGLVDLMLEIRRDPAAVAGVFNELAGIAERRKPVRSAIRRLLASILRAANPKLPEKLVADAAAAILYVLRNVPNLAAEQEDSGRPLLRQTRKMLAAYLGVLLGARS